VVSTASSAQPSELSKNIDFQRVRVISLDLDDTLWPIMPAIDRADEQVMHWFREHAPRVAQRYDVAGIRELRHEVSERHPHLSHDLGALRRLCFRLALQNCAYDPRLAQPAWELYYQYRLAVELYPDAQRMLQRLSSKLPLVAVTNGNADLQRIGLGHHFQLCIRAADVALRKPDTRIWQLLCQRLQLPPEAILHVGDHPLEDAESAHQAGLQALWLNRQQKPWPQNSPQLPHIQHLDELTEACLAAFI